MTNERIAEVAELRKNIRDEYRHLRKLRDTLAEAQLETATEEEEPDFDAQEFSIYEDSMIAEMDKAYARIRRLESALEKLTA